MTSEVMDWRHGAWHGHRMWTITRPTEVAFRYLYVFRTVVVGLMVVGAVVGWLAHIPWLLAVCVCVGIGEWLESSYYLTVMRWGQRRGTLPPSARP